MKKRILCILLALCMLVPAMVACGKDNSPEGETTASDGSGNTTTADTTSKYEVYDDLGEYDLDGEVIEVLTTGYAWNAGELWVEKYTGDIINDAIFTRNSKVESRFNCEIKEVNVSAEGNLYEVGNHVGTSIQAGTHDYDLALPATYTGTIFAARGYWTDLTKSNTVDLSKDYWSQLYNEQLSIGGSQYMASGAVSLSYYRLTYVTLVNDGVLSGHSDAPNLIDVVNEKKWTIEYQKELTAKYYVDTVGNGKDENDIFGFICPVYNGVNPYLSSCEVSMLSKDSGGYYTLALDNERLIGVVDQVIGLLSADSTWVVQGHSPTAFDDAAEMFAAGQGLMMTNILLSVENSNVREMEGTYTILPIPKYTEAQETYYSFVHDSFTSMAIPSSAPAWDVDTYGAIMEGLCSESYRTVTPAYYEKALKGKYLDNPESLDMLEMITSNVYIDAGEAYTKNCGDLLNPYRTVVEDAVLRGKGNLIASTFNTEFKQQINDNLLRLNAAIKQLQMLT